MPELSGRELLGEWRSVMESVLQTAAAVPRSELGRELLRASQRQLELVQDVVDRERSLQGELAARVFAPLDALFDLLEESGVSLHRQAETLEAAGVALQETATLLHRQAELFERAIGALRQPAEFAKSAAGVTRTSGTRGRARGGTARSRAGAKTARAGGGTKPASGKRAAAAKPKAGGSAKRFGGSKAAGRGSRS